MKKKVFIHIGGLYCSNKPTIIETILGSCVAVCLHDPVAGIGGMNHILLPGQADMKRFDAVARYGINAMELLINKMLSAGACRPRLVAKTFGGAHILPSISPKNGTGQKNIEFVVDFLTLESITITGYSMGGQDTRRIYFHTDTGEVFMKRIPSSSFKEITTHEKRLLNKVRTRVVEAGDIALFE